MAKKKYVNEVDGFFIMSHRQTMTLQELANKLKLESAIIREYIDSKIDTKTVTEIKPASSDDVKAFDVVGKKDGAVVMTQSASEIGDTVRGRIKVNTTHLHKIRD